MEKILKQKYLKFEYKGKPTKKALQIQRMQQERDYWDKERWSLDNLPAFMAKYHEKNKCTFWAVQGRGYPTSFSAQNPEGIEYE